MQLQSRLSLKTGHSQDGYKQTGFTLIEVVIAVAIIAIVIFAAYSGFSGFLSLSKETKKANLRQQEIMAALNFLETDFRYIVDRTARNSYGDFQPPFTTERLSVPQAVVELTTLRPDFLYDEVAIPQRVSWQINDGRLVRHHWVVADQASTTESIKVGFLHDLRSFTVSPVEDENIIRTETDSTLGRKLPNGRPLPDLPAAVEIEIEFEDGHKISRFIEVISTNRS